jgi:hypothetical protein
MEVGEHHHHHKHEVQVRRLKGLYLIAAWRNLRKQREKDHHNGHKQWHDENSLQARSKAIWLSIKAPMNGHLQRKLRQKQHSD